MTRRSVLAAVLVAVASLSAQAQTVKVEFLMGKVNLVAQDASLRAIMTEWARVGGTRLVNPERLTGGPVTLELVGVPERQALDILMRDVGGYILGPRAALVAGVSVVRPPGRRRRRGGETLASGTRRCRAAAAAGTCRRGPIEREPIVDDADDEPDTPERAEPATRARPGAPMPTPGLPPLPQTQPAPEPARPTPGNPFGAVPGASRPGVVQPAAPAQPPAETPPQN